ncbi:MAG: hypothetical protein U5K81_02480 [Trueperaceae bacterium]|nr:hypothetical protein [Trueperaceae bacterium]
MNRLRIFAATLFTLTLAFGLWTLAAVSFDDTSSSFADGDVLQASDLNDLFGTINDNFSDAQTQINTNETDIATNASDIGALQNDKVDVAGDTMSGRLEISADAESPDDLDANTVFYVENTNTGSGSAAVFSSQNDEDDVGAVTVKQQGAGPAIALKSNGNGPFIAGANALNVTLVAEEDGSLRLGDMGTGGTEDPTLHLDASEGTISNDVGSGLPLAFGTVDDNGAKYTGTDNWTASYDGSNNVYRIDIDGVNYDYRNFTTVVTPVAATIQRRPYVPLRPDPSHRQLVDDRRQPRARRVQLRHLRGGQLNPRGTFERSAGAAGGVPTGCTRSWMGVHA